MILSDRFKHAFKIALAVVIAYAIALYMDWDKPIWAGYTAASVSLDATGQSIQKGLNRIVGALVGSIAGFILLAFFIQDRWLFFMLRYAPISASERSGTIISGNRRAFSLWSSVSTAPSALRAPS